MSAPALPPLRGPRVDLVPVTGDDLPSLIAILRSPAVAPWWGPAAGDAELADDLLNDGNAYALRLDDETIGWLGVNECPAPDNRHVAFDIAMAETHHRRGLGPEALLTVIRWLIDERGHHRFTIDPALDNARAIRAYEKVGFRPVGVMRKYERGPDGSWHDNLLMDLLADEVGADLAPGSGER